MVHTSKIWPLTDKTLLYNGSMSFGIGRSPLKGLLSQFNWSQTGVPIDDGAENNLSTAKTWTKFPVQ